MRRTDPGADTRVTYVLTKTPIDSRELARYRLERTEGSGREVVIEGDGLAARLRAVTFLREVGELGGPDATAATTALRAGWKRVPG